MVTLPQRIHNWILEQNNNLPKHRETKKRWKKTANNEVFSSTFAPLHLY